MNKVKSRTHTFPPSGWQFVDARTGMRFGDGDFNDVVAAIIKNRRANPRLYPTDEIVAFDFASVGNELDAFTCARLGGKSPFCESGDPIPVDVSDLILMTMPNACPKCSCTEGYEILCRTCAGRRVIGFYCRDCKTMVAK